MSNCAIGFRVHSGWAAAVAVTEGPKVVDRRVIVIADPAIDGSKQPFHAAEGRPFKKAEDLILRCGESTNALAAAALGEMLTGLRTDHKVIGCGLLLSSTRTLPDLKAILASHAMIHAAEGEFFRDAMARSARNCRLPVHRVREKDLWRTCESEMHVPAEALARRIGALGKELGPPWRQDEKLAALVAWLVLATQ